MARNRPRKKSKKTSDLDTALKTPAAPTLEASVASDLVNQRNPSAKFHRFMDLPPELRNLIYKFAVRQDLYIEPFDEEWKNPPRYRRVVAPPSLLKQPQLPNIMCASKAIRKECAGLYWSENHFRFHMPSNLHYPWVSLIDWLRKRVPVKFMSRLSHLELKQTPAYVNKLADLAAYQTALIVAHTFVCLVIRYWDQPSAPIPPVTALYVATDAGIDLAVTDVVRAAANLAIGVAAWWAMERSLSGLRLTYFSFIDDDLVEKVQDLVKAAGYQVYESSDARKLV
ncbi:hypothetical protein MBLNU459_g4024t1 [Dothideomycetes sp. NU459]